MLCSSPHFNPFSDYSPGLIKVLHKAGNYGLYLKYIEAWIQDWHLLYYVEKLTEINCPGHQKNVVYFFQYRSIGCI